MNQRVSEFANDEDNPLRQAHFNDEFRMLIAEWNAATPDKVFSPLSSPQPSVPACCPYKRSFSIQANQAQFPRGHSRLYRYRQAVITSYPILYENRSAFVGIRLRFRRNAECRKQSAEWPPGVKDQRHHP